MRTCQITATNTSNHRNTNMMAHTTFDGLDHSGTGGGGGGGLWLSLAHGVPVLVGAQGP